MFLLIFFSLVFLYLKISRRKVEIIAPTIFFFIMMVLYFSGVIFSSFIYGNVFIILLSIGALVYLIYDMLKSNMSWLKILKEFQVLIILYIVMAILLIGFKSKIWDDFSHWLLTVKNMFLFNELSNNKNSTIYFKTYPPATAIIQYFYNYIQNIFFKNINLEYNSQLITNYFVLILLLSIVNMTKLNSKAKRILYPILFIIPAIFNSQIYIGLYVDVILAVMGVYLLIYYEYAKVEKINKKFVVIDMVLATLFLVLIKPTGSAIIIFCLIYIILDLIIMKNYKFNLQVIITILISFFIGKKSWEYYMHKTNVGVIWRTEKITFGSILNILNGKGENYQYETINNFFKALIKTKISLFSYIIFFILTIGILIFRYLKRKNNKNLKILIFNALVIVIYPISLLIMYVFIFGPGEAVKLASFKRYLSTIVIFLIILDTLLIAKSEKILKYGKIIILLFLVLFFKNNTMKILTIKRFKYIKTVNEERQEIKKIPKEIEKNHNNKIYFVSNMNKDQGYYYWVFRYEATPLKIQEFYHTDEKNLFETLKGYDYIYVKDFDEDFSKKYSTLFKDHLEPNNFYKIYLNPFHFELVK